MLALPNGTHVQVTIALNDKVTPRLASIKRTYGLLPAVWRRLRKKHPGCVPDIVVYGRDGKRLGEAFLHRYDSMISIPISIRFEDISWIETIERCQTPEGILGPSNIAIGATKWGS